MRRPEARAPCARSVPSTAHGALGRPGYTSVQSKFLGGRGVYCKIRKKFCASNKATNLAIGTVRHLVQHISASFDTLAELKPSKSLTRVT